MSVRMQIYLTRELYRRLKDISRSSGRPMAEHVRESLNKYLEETDQVKPSGDDPIWEIAGGGESEVTDLSVQHDHYIYAPEKGVEK